MVWVAAGALLAATIGLTTAAVFVPVERSRLHMLLLGMATLCFIPLGILIARRRELTRRLVLGASIVLLTLMVAAPPSNSDDVWAYWFHGRILAVHHQNPALHAPAEFAGDPFLERVRPIWRNDGTVYGPAFVAISAGIAGVAGDSPLTARLLFQGLAAAAVLASLLLLARRKAPAAAMAFLGLNPIVAAMVVNGAHNDILAGVALLAMVVLFQKGRWQMAASVAAFAALVKLTALLPIAIFGLVLLRRGRAIDALKMGAMVLGLIMVAYIFMGGAAALGPVLRASDSVGFSIWEMPHQLLRLAAARDPARNITPLTSAPAWVLAAVVTVAALVALVGRWNSRAGAVVAGSAVFFFGASYVLPWYGALLLPLAAMAYRERQARLLFAGMILLSGMYLAALAPGWRGGAWLTYIKIRAGFGVWGMLAVAILLAWAIVRALRAGSSLDINDQPERASV